MSNKKKKQLLDLKSELHAISPLALEVVIDRLDHLRSSNTGLEVEFVSENAVNFRLWRRNTQFTNAEAAGTLRRWQGTETRADVDSKATILGECIDWVIQFAKLTGLIVLFLLSLSLMFLWLFWQVIPLEVFFIIVVPIASLLGYRTYNYIGSGSIFDKQRYQAFREVDTLMQSIADVLTKGDDEKLLEFDGTEDALSRLLTQRDEGMKATMGSDGEMV